MYLLPSHFRVLTSDDQKPRTRTRTIGTTNRWRNPTLKLVRLVEGTSSTELFPSPSSSSSSSFSFSVCLGGLRNALSPASDGASPYHGVLRRSIARTGS